MVLQALLAVRRGATGEKKREKEAPRLRNRHQAEIAKLKNISV